MCSWRGRPLGRACRYPIVWSDQLIHGLLLDCVVTDPTTPLLLDRVIYSLVDVSTGLVDLPDVLVCVIEPPHTAVEHVGRVQILTRIPMALAETREKILIILDDVLDSEHVFRRRGKNALVTCYSMGRHYNISVIMCTQYAKSACRTAGTQSATRSRPGTGCASSGPSW